MSAARSPPSSERPGVTATEIALYLVGSGALAAWVFLVIGRNGFWHADQHLNAVRAPDAWPAVLVVVSW